MLHSQNCKTTIHNRYPHFQTHSRKQLSRPHPRMRCRGKHAPWSTAGPLLAHVLPYRQSRRVAVETTAFRKAEALIWFFTQGNICGLCHKAWSQSSNKCFCGEESQVFKNTSLTLSHLSTKVPIQE